MDRGKKERTHSTAERPPHKACHTTKSPAVLRTGQEGERKKPNKSPTAKGQNGYHELSLSFRQSLTKICSISPVQIRGGEVMPHNTTIRK